MTEEKMFEEYFKIFGKKINNAICLLKPMGIWEFAWRYSDVFDAIEILNNKKIPIIGGDVLVKENNRIEFAYTYWSTNNPINSYEESVKYIKKLIDKEKLYYVLIFEYRKYLNLHNDDEDVRYIH